MLVLLTSLFIVKPLEFSAFPTGLLIATMLRLALDLASTRLILADGRAGPHSDRRAGQARRFDLLVRIEQPLPPDLRRVIGKLYLAARDVAGLVGEIRFRAGRWVALPEPAGAGGPAGITV